MIVLSDEIRSHGAPLKQTHGGPVNQNKRQVLKAGISVEVTNVDRLFNLLLKRSFMSGKHSRQPTRVLPA